MKVQSLKTGIGSTIFILLIFAAFAVVRPVYNKLNVFVRTTVDSLRSEFEQQTGLTFSYSSLSPSILSAISLKGIVVSDLQNSQKILSVRSLTLSYNLKNTCIPQPIVINLKTIHIRLQRLLLKSLFNES